MKYIKLTQGKQTEVDDDLYDWLNQWKWYYKKQPDGNGGYACRTLNARIGNRNKTLRMHNMILPPSPGYLTDHEDTNKLNNQRSNLRYCNRAENTRNGPARVNNTSGHKGIYWHKRDKAWRVQLTVDYKKIFIGNYQNIEEAVRSRDTAYSKHHGKFANTSDKGEV